MEAGGFDDHQPPRVRGECRYEGFQVRDVVGHMVTRDDVGRRYLVGDIRPTAGDAASPNAACASPLSEQAEHRLIRIDSSQRRRAR